MLPAALPGAQVDARSFILVDFRTDKILASLQPTERMEPPASPS